MANIKICKRFPNFFTLALTISNVKICIFDLQKVRQCHRCHCQCHPQNGSLMANDKSYKRLTHTYALAQTVSETLKVLIFLPSKSRSRSQSIIVTMTMFNGKCQNLQKTPTHFCASYYCFRDLKYLNFVSLKHGKCHIEQIYASTLFDGKCSNLQKTPTYFLC